MTTPSQPPVLLKPADTPSPGSTTTVAGSITLSIADHNYTLTGTVGQYVIVEYHASFDDAINLGTIDSIATRIGQDIGFPDLGTEIQTVKGSLSSVPAVQSIFDAITHASVKITDLEINTQTGAYGIGLAVDFSQLPAGMSPPSLLGVELISFGFTVTKTKSSSTTPPAQ